MIIGSIIRSEILGEIMSKAIGSAQAPAFDTRTVSLETAAAGYEANGADTDFMGVWLSDSRATLDSVEWMRDYRASAERVFESTFTRPA